MFWTNSAYCVEEIASRAPFFETLRSMIAKFSLLPVPIFAVCLVNESLFKKLYGMVMCMSFL